MMFIVDEYYKYSDSPLDFDDQWVIGRFKGRDVTGFDDFEVIETRGTWSYHLNVGSSTFCTNKLSSLFWKHLPNYKKRLVIQLEIEELVK